MLNKIIEVVLWFGCMYFFFRVAMGFAESFIDWVIEKIEGKE